jgi:hypothetical protein
MWIFFVRHIHLNGTFEWFCAQHLHGNAPVGGIGLSKRNHWLPCFETQHHSYSLLVLVWGDVPNCAAPSFQ